jgi:hypothetical protein
LDAAYAAAFAGQRGDVDDRPARLLIDHHTSDVLAHEERPGEIHVQQSAPQLRFEVEHRRPIGTERRSGVVDQDVDPPHVLQHRVHERPDRIVLRNVADDGEGPSIQGANFVGDCLRPAIQP